MLTIRAMSDGVGYASNHLEHRDYYAEGERVVGYWQGRGAERLGLAGGVKSDDFEALRQGLDPKSGEFLRPRKSADRLASDGTTQSHGRTLYDFTISAPKSVSIMAILGGDERLIIAHEKAVSAALQELELHAGVRVRKEGANENRISGNLVLAVYHHDTSRELDPQLHTHAVAANLSFDEVEGRWKALQASGIYERRAYLTEVYRNALAQQVRALGYEIDNRREKKGRDAGFEIRGISDELLAKFSQRTRQRDTAIQQFVRENGREPTDNEVAVLIRETRAEKLIEISTAEVRKRQQERLTRADRQRVIESRARSKPQRVRLDSAAASLDYAKEHIFERVSVTGDHDLLTEALRHGRGRIDHQELKDRIQSDESFLRDGNQVTTAESLMREREMIEAINRGIGTFPRLGGRISFIPSQTLRAEQREAIQFVLDSRDRAVNIQGAAGTGKTATLRELQRALRDAGHEVLAIAPTMSAVEELQNVGFRNALTVERLLQDKRSHTTLSCQVLILDEAGMVSGRQMWELLHLAERQSARIVFCGDTKQIQSVEACDALRVLEKESQLKSIRLARVERQKAKAYREAVEELRGDPQQGFVRLEMMGAVREVGCADRAEAVATAYAQAKSQQGKTLVVCATHDEINRVTEAIRSSRKVCGELRQPVVLTRQVSLNWTTAQKKNMRNFAPGQMLAFHRQVKGIKKNETIEVIEVKRNRLMIRNERGERHVLTRKQARAFDVLETMPIEVASGDQLLLMANRREPGFRATNGEIVVATGVDAAGRIQLEDGRLLPSNFKQFAHGYAVTAHRGQGKSVDSVVISADGMQRELFYVAASRGRDSIVVITSDKERLRESIERSTARKSACEVARKQPSEKKPAIRRMAFQNAAIGRTEEPHRIPAHKDPADSGLTLTRIDKSLMAAEAMAKKALGEQAKISAAQTESGIYRGEIIGETDTHVLQRLSARMAIAHEKHSLAFVPRLGAQVSIVYSRQLGAIREIAARERDMELSR